MNNLAIFNYKNLGSVRTVMDERGEPWFCLSDVCGVLGIVNPSKLATRLRQKGITSSYTLTNGGEQSLLFVDESNLYETIFASRKPEAKEFRFWITSEVIPSIRKTGSYFTPQTFIELHSNPEKMIPFLDMWKSTIIENQELKEKVEFLTAENGKLVKEVGKLEEEVERLTRELKLYHTFINCEDTITMGDAAKILSFKNVGRNKLFQILRDEGVIFLDTDGRNKPYSRYTSAKFGYFKMTEYEYTDKYGNIKIGTRIETSQRGMEFMRRLLLRLDYEEYRFDKPSYQVIPFN